MLPSVLINSLDCLRAASKCFKQCIRRDSTVVRQMLLLPDCSVFLFLQAVFSDISFHAPIFIPFIPPFPSSRDLIRKIWNPITVYS